MSGKWFANRGQIIQAIAAVVSACAGSVALYFVLKTNNSLPKATYVLYISAIVFVFSIGLFIGRRSSSAPMSTETKTPPAIASPAPPAPPVHIEVNPTISPTISSTMGHPPADRPEKKEQTIVPNVGCLKPERIHVTHDDEADIWIKSNLLEGEAGDIPGVVIPFCNEPQRGKKTAPVEGVKARLTFYRADGIEVFRRIDSGCWLGQAYNSIRLGVGEIVYLLAVLDGPMTITNPRYSSARYSEDVTSANLLPQGLYELKVDLIGGDHGEFHETFWFKIAAGDTATITRLNQQPTQHS